MNLTNKIKYTRHGDVLSEFSILIEDITNKNTSSSIGNIKTLTEENKIFTISQPTINDLKCLIHIINSDIVWINTRINPFIYIDGIPYELRDKKKFNEISFHTQYLNYKNIESLEHRLKENILHEIINNKGLLKLHKIENNELKEYFVTPEKILTLRETLENINKFNNANMKQLNINKINNEKIKIKYYRIPLLKGRFVYMNNFLSQFIKVVTNPMNKNSYFVINTRNGTFTACFLRCFMYLIKNHLHKHEFQMNTFGLGGVEGIKEITHFNKGDHKDDNDKDKDKDKKDKDDNKSKDKDDNDSKDKDDNDDKDKDHNQINTKFNINFNKKQNIIYQTCLRGNFTVIKNLEALLSNKNAKQSVDKLLDNSEYNFKKEIVEKLLSGRNLTKAVDYLSLYGTLILYEEFVYQNEHIISKIKNKKSEINDKNYKSLNIKSNIKSLNIKSNDKSSNDKSSNDKSSNDKSSNYEFFALTFEHWISIREDFLNFYKFLNKKIFERKVFSPFDQIETNSNDITSDDSINFIKKGLYNVLIKNEIQPFKRSFGRVNIISQPDNCHVFVISDKQYDNDYKYINDYNDNNLYDNEYNSDNTNELIKGSSSLKHIFKINKSDLFLNLREEPTIYIKGEIYLLRESCRIYKHPTFLRRCTVKHIERIEENLKNHLIDELKVFGHIKVYKIESNDDKHGDNNNEVDNNNLRKLSKNYVHKKIYLENVTVHDILTPKEYFKKIGIINYHRLPITHDLSFLITVFDQLYSILKSNVDNRIYIFSHNSRGRAAFVALLTLLFDKRNSTEKSYQSNQYQSNPLKTSYQSNQYQDNSLENNSLRNISYQDNLLSNNQYQDGLLSNNLYQGNLLNNNSFDIKPPFLTNISPIHSLARHLNNSYQSITLVNSLFLKIFSEHIHEHLENKKNIKIARRTLKRYFMTICFASFLFGSHPISFIGWLNKRKDIMNVYESLNNNGVRGLRLKSDKNKFLESKDKRNFSSSNKNPTLKSHIADSFFINKIFDNSTHSKEILELQYLPEIVKRRGTVLSAYTILKNDYFLGSNLYSQLNVNGVNNYRQIIYEGNLIIGLSMPRPEGIESVICNLNDFLRKKECLSGEFNDDNDNNTDDNNTDDNNTDDNNTDDNNVDDNNTDDNDEDDNNADDNNTDDNDEDDLNKIINSEKEKNPKINWFCLREEPVLYVNDQPYVLRIYTDMTENITARGINWKILHNQEDVLKSEAVDESKNGKLLVHDEEFINGEIITIGRHLKVNSLKTPEEVFRSYPINYYRVPITDEHVPIPQNYNFLFKKILSIPKPRILIFNCQMGKGRTTNGMLIAFLTIYIRERKTELKLIDYPPKYSLIVHLLQILPRGRESKKIVDAAIDKFDHLENFREIIEKYKNKDGSYQQKGCDFLVRYFYLICFAEFLLIGSDDFEDFLIKRPEIEALCEEVDPDNLLA
ncbi:Paladin [Dictyocoela muelleri]|nr:Paladin [Dictyocoela muelleri]